MNMTDAARQSCSESEFTDNLAAIIPVLQKFVAYMYVE